jgi:hypothetical protein
MGQIVVTEFIPLDGVIESPGRARTTKTPAGRLISTVHVLVDELRLMVPHHPRQRKAAVRGGHR